jgi:DNA invertase Pin-like site-specific DNA recombinase
MTTAPSRLSRWARELDAARERADVIARQLVRLSALTRCIGTSSRPAAIATAVAADIAVVAATARKERDELEHLRAQVLEAAQQRSSLKVFSNEPFVLRVSC